MLELAILFAVISSVVRPFGAAYADVANTTLGAAGICAAAWLLAGLVALVTQRPHRAADRRVLHHA